MIQLREICFKGKKMTKRNLYLKTTPVEEAIKKYMEVLEAAGCLVPAKEKVDTYDSLGRVTAEAVFARCCSPLFNSAAMDGIRVAEEIAGIYKPLDGKA